MSSFLANSAPEPSEVACKRLARILKKSFCILPLKRRAGGERRDTGDCPKTDLLCGSFTGEHRL
jgi:hypothetical protein